jgi:hypothetical protein
MKKLALALTAWLLAASVASAQVITGSVPNTFTNGTIIDATQMNADFTYIINQANANAAKNGVNSDITALTALATPLTPGQSGSNIYYAGTSTGTANAQVVSLVVPANFTLAAGKTIRFIAGFSNTGATTLAVNGLAATNVYTSTPYGPIALTGGEIVTGTITEAYYDGTQYQLITHAQETGGYGPLTSIAAAATTDLGMVPGHNVNISGGPVTITSFGSSASGAYPIYLVRYNAANILTQSVNLVLLGGVSRLTAASDQGLYLYGGAGAWYELAYFPATVKYAPTIANALWIRNNAGTPASQIDIAAAEMVMDNASGGSYYTENYGTCTINFGVVGAAGLDAGAIAANTWYYIYAIGTGIANSCLVSTSATAPVLPTGYTYKMRIGSIRTYTATATLWLFSQRGNRLNLLPTISDANAIAQGVLGTCPATLAATTALYGTLAPTNAASAIVQLEAQGSSTVCINNYAGGVNVVPASCVTATTAAYQTSRVELTNTGTATIFACSTAAAGLATVQGWLDAVNAN